MKTLEHFTENSRLYRRDDPAAAAAIAAADCSGYTLCLTHVGQQNLQLGDHYYHNNDDAMQEMRAVARALPLDNHQVVVAFGIGMGYLFDALRGWLESDVSRMLIFIEDDAAVVRRFFETARARVLLMHPQVLIKVLKPLEGNFAVAFEHQCSDITGAYLAKTPCIALLPHYRQLRADVCRQLRTQVLLGSGFEQMARTELTYSRREVFGNFYTNMLRCSGWQLELSLRDAFAGVPAIICGAGPSISEQLPALKAIENRALIFGAGTGINVLNANGIFPHFGIGLDPTEFQASRVRTNYAYETPFFVRSRLNVQASHTLHGPKIYVNGLATSRLSNWFEEQLAIATDAPLPTGISSSNFAIDQAIALGCNPIILVGMDLAYSASSRYPAVIKAHPAEPKNVHHEVAAQTSKQIVGYSSCGTHLNTKYEWLIESNIISECSYRNPDVRIYNATPGGLLIRGIPYRPFDTLINEELGPPLPLKAKIHRIIHEAATVTAPPVRLFEVMERWLASLQTLLRLYASAKEEISLLWNGVLAGNPLPESPPYSATFNAIAQQLEQEPVTHFLLDELRLFFDKLAFNERRLLRCYPERLSHQGRDLKRLELLLNEVIFFEETLSFHEQRVIEALESEEERQRLIASKGGVPPPEVPKGEVIERYANGATAVIKRGHEEAFLYPDGALASLRCRDGVSRYYYRDGTLKSTLPHRAAVLNGTVMLYYPNGALFREIPFVDGLLDGVEREWNEAGLLIIEATYKAGSACGVARRWHRNGQLAHEAHFEEGGSCSSLETWDEEGRPTTPQAQMGGKREVIIEAIDAFYQEAVQFNFLNTDDFNHAFERELSHE